MIWVAGRVVADEALKIVVTDRTFEHGLGLFETFRTWGRRPVTLDRHRDRLIRSARALGLPLDPSALPDKRAVSDLLEAEGLADDSGLRVTLSGGVSDSAPSVVWMRTRPLPPPEPAVGAVVVLGDHPIAFDDPLARHKTLNYWAKRIAWERGRAAGADDVLLTTPDGQVWEGTRTNLFLARGDTLRTPDLAGPVLPGVMRSLVLEAAGRLGLRVVEGDVTAMDLGLADEVFLTNSGRGIVPVGRLGLDTLEPGLQRSFDVPGSLTDRIRAEVLRWLADEGRAGEFS